MIINKIFSSRFRDDGKTVLPLRDVQLKEIERYQEKVKTNYYNKVYIEICPLCGDDVGLLISEKDRYGISLKTVVCRKCGLLRTYDQLDEQSTKRFYEEQYRMMYEEDRIDGVDYQFVEERFVDTTRNIDAAKYLVRLLNLDPAKHTIVEIGAGGGWNLLPYKELGFRCVGCDFDDAYLELGRKKGLELIYGSTEEMYLYLGGKVNFILLSHVLEHTSDPVKFLSKVAGLLEIGGYLRIMQPGLRVIRWGYAEGDLLHTLQGAHNYLFDLYTLKLAAGVCGLRMIWGDETLTCIFQNDNERTPLPLLASRGNLVLNYLRSLETTRRYYWKGWNKVISLTRTPQRTRALILKAHYCLGYPRQYFIQKLVQRFMFHSSEKDIVRDV